ncbi:MAG: sulfotransferase [Pseudomonadota bacterium]
MNLQYLFVCGCPRSGTTSMTYRLAEHPEIMLGVERFKRMTNSAARLDELQPALFEEERFFDFRDSDTNNTPEKRESFANHYALMRERYAGGRMRVIGDKHPGYFRHYDALDSRFPDARFVFMLRHPAAVARSYEARLARPNDRWQWSGEDAVNDWNESIQRTRDFMARAPGRLFVCQFERFYAGDVDYYRELLAFVGVTPDSAAEQAYLRSTKRWDARSEGYPTTLPAGTDVETLGALGVSYGAT